MEQKNECVLQDLSHEDIFSLVAEITKPFENITEAPLEQFKNFVNTLLNLERFYEIFQEKIKSLNQIPQIAELNLQRLIFGTGGFFNLPGYPLGECTCCNTGTHHRFILGNTRTKIESSIIQEACSYDRYKPLSLLSLGSGYLLQDLIIAVKLVDLGFSNLHFVLVDPINEEDYFQPFRIVFDNTIQRLKEIYGNQLHISTEFHSSLTTVISADIAYAIDFDNWKLDGKDYSTRQLFKRQGNITDKNYGCMISVFKMLLSAPFCVVSQGKELLLFSDDGRYSPLTEYFSLHELLEINTLTIGSLYFNADLLHLLLNLNYIKNTRFPLFINKNIIKQEDKPFIEALLHKYDRTCFFLEEAMALQQLQELEGECLILDYTAFDLEAQEFPFTKEYEGFKNLSVIRKNWIHKEKGPAEYTLIYKGNPNQASIDRELALLQRKRELNGRKSFIKGYDINTIKVCCDQNSGCLFVNEEEFIQGNEDVLLIDRESFNFLNSNAIQYTDDELVDEVLVRKLESSGLSYALHQPKPLSKQLCFSLFTSYDDKLDAILNRKRVLYSRENLITDLTSFQSYRSDFKKKGIILFVNEALFIKGKEDTLFINPEAFKLLNAYTDWDTERPFDEVLIEKLDAKGFAYQLEHPVTVMEIGL
jgi:hypothetical protein